MADPEFEPDTQEAKALTGFLDKQSKCHPTDFNGISFTPSMQ